MEYVTKELYDNDTNSLIDVIKSRDKLIKKLAEDKIKGTERETIYINKIKELNQIIKKSEPKPITGGLNDDLFKSLIKADYGISDDEYEKLQKEAQKEANDLLNSLI